MTQKKLFAWLAGIIVCSFTAITVTSCSVEDKAAYTYDDEIEIDLIGKWAVDMGHLSKTEGYINKMIIILDTDGVVNTEFVGGNSYDEVLGIPEDRWASYSHGIYRFDKVAQTVTFENLDIYGLPPVCKYSVEDGELVLRDIISDYELRLHRPTFEEKEMFIKYSQDLYTRNYLGKWVRTYEENGQTTYVLANFLVDFYETFYTVTTNGKVTKKDVSRRMSDNTTDKANPILDISEPNSNTDFKEYWWKTEGHNLYIGENGKEKATYTWHQLTKAEDKMFNEFEETAIIADLQESLVGNWYIEDIFKDTPETDFLHSYTYEPDGTMYYTPSINVLMELGLWDHHFKGSYTINGNVIEQQVTVPDKNIVFTKHLNTLSTDGFKLDAVINAETFVDGESRSVVKDLEEKLSRVTSNSSEGILGMWEGYRMMGEDPYVKFLTPSRFEFKNDGTFTFYKLNYYDEWEAEDRTLSEYFVVNNMLYMRWKDAGSDEMKYQSWISLTLDDDYTGSGSFLSLIAYRKIITGKIDMAYLYFEKVND